MKFFKARAGLFILLALYFALVAVSWQSNTSLPDRLQDTVTLSLGVFYEAFPFVVLGIILSVCVQMFVPDSFLLRMLPKNRTLRTSALSLSGSFLPVCECGNVPLARGLIAKGIKPSDSFAFLLAAPIINPVTALTTWQAFPAVPLVLAIRMFAAFVIANIVAWTLSTRKDSGLITENFRAYCDHTHESTKALGKKSTNFKKKLMLFSHKFTEEAARLLPALISGSLIAGIIQTTIPRSWLTQVAAEPVLAILVMILLAFVVSICANVDAFFALSLSGIFPLSAIVAFLVFGPMIDIKMLALLRTTFKPRVLVHVTILVFLLAFLTGLGAHYVI